MNILTKMLPELPQDTLRLVFRTLEALSDEAGPDALVAVEKSLVWMRVWHELTCSELDPNKIADLVESNTRVSSVVARLCVEGTNFDSEAGPESTLEHLIQIDQQLQKLDGLSAAEQVDAVFENTELLLNFVGERSGLIALMKLEEAWNPRRLDHTDLGERSKKFEFAAIDHLRAHGFMPVVRAALAFEADGPEFYELSAFRDNPHLRELARAIAASRQRVFDVARGIRPVRDLVAWVNYLIVGTKGLSHALGLSRKEALSFAHFCFHVVNFSDLEGTLGAELNEECRRSMMDVEDALKEVAQMRASDELVDAATLERAIDPWPAKPNLHRLADRLARLSGLWFEGSPSKGLVGMGRIDLSLCQPFIDALDQLEPSDLVGVSEILRSATLLGADFAEVSASTTVRVFSLLYNKGIGAETLELGAICQDLAGRPGLEVVLTSPKVLEWLQVGANQDLRFNLPAELEHLVGLMESETLGQTARGLVLEYLSSHKIDTTNSAILPVDRDVKVSETRMNFDDGIGA